MFIQIEELKEEPLRVQHVYGVEELPFDHEDAFLAEPIAVDFTLTHKERDLQLGGSVATSVRFVCSRCLLEYTKRVATSFDLFYLPQPDSKGLDEEMELKYEDMDVGFYDGIRLDVDLMVLEQIELSIPMRFICQEECKGLCPTCGADLNRGACRCPAEEPDSRLAVLLEFKKKLEQ